jgi:hypothetical protein
LAAVEVAGFLAGAGLVAGAACDQLNEHNAAVSTESDRKIRVDVPDMYAPAKILMIATFDSTAESGKNY